jgi:hypothetical protein
MVEKQIWRKRSRSENKERKATTDLLVVFLVVLQVMAVLTAGEERKKGGGHYRSPLLPGFRGGAWRRRAATVHNHRRCPEFSSAVPEAIFVIFKYCCVCLDTVVF